MFATTRTGLVVAIVALSVASLVSTNAAGSYLSALLGPDIVSSASGNNGPSPTAGGYLAALRRSSSEPTLNRQQVSQAPQAHYRNNFHRSSTARQHNNGARGGGCRTDYKFDYIMLTLQWGPGSCATSPRECKRVENKLFTIHGMWPQFWDANSPAFCCFDNTFDFNAIQPILPELNKYWFSYFDNNSRGFWSHEWLKHGTCLRDIKPLQGEQQYFSNTLNIVKKLPVLETLAKAGIVPGDKKVYNSVDVQNALKQLTHGKSAKVECDLEAHQPTALLKGVDFCFDINLNFIDCPPSKSRCQRQLLFLN